ncbi:MAG: NAD(P)/FAD-dependent oxidoreductase [Armatimonadota bacterium]|nr:NAD(P)/FAD-dependent oxidoreductase [Armatimonadota bacterium]
MAADAVIVGAGPAGSATGLLLARLGHRVTIVDKARFPRPKPCGEYLNPSAVAVLDRLGVRDVIEPLGVSLSGMWLTGMDASVWSPFDAGRGLLIPRERLDHMLLLEAGAAGAEVIEGFRVETVTTGPAPSVRGRHDGRPVRLDARLIVGADGLRSVVARHRGSWRGAATGHYTLGAHFEGLASDTPRGDLHLGPGWYVGAALYGRGRGNVVAALPQGMYAGARGRIDTLFERVCAALPALRRLTQRARRIGPFVAAGPLTYVRRPAVDDGLLLVGDAASAINPMTGEGIALALRGAELAACAADHALRSGRTDRRSLAPYERARIEAFHSVWRMSRLLQWIVRRPRIAAPLFARLAGNPSLAARLLGVASGVRPAGDVLSPAYLIRLLCST